MQVIAKGRVAYLVPVPTLDDLQDGLSDKLSSEDLRDKKDRKL